jgi:hypothetical protein
MRILRFNENSVDFDFYKSKYIEDEKSIICAYYVDKIDDRSITIINLQENEMEDRVSLAGNIFYWVNPVIVRIATSQLEIISDVPGKENYKFVKIPYWLYKRNRGLEIKRINKTKNLSYIKSQVNKDFIDKLKDERIFKCFKVTATNIELNSYVRIIDVIESYLNKK